GGRVGGVAGEVAHDDVARAPARLDNGAHGGRGGAVGAAIAGQDGERAVAAPDPGRREGRVEGGGRDAAVFDPDAGPAQAAEVLGAEDEVEAAAEGVAVDEQGAPALAHRRDG